MDLKAREDDLRILRLLIRPIIRFCIRRGLYVHEVEEMAKNAFVELAEEEIRKISNEVTVSRIAVLTGIYRKEVHRLFKIRESKVQEPASILGRVIGQWRQDKRYRNRAGEPRLLSYEGGNSEFFRLVEQVTRHVNPAAVLFELERTKAAVRTPRGLKLVREDNQAGIDRVHGYELASRDIQTLLDTIDDNLSPEDPIGHLHVRTEYDNIYIEDLPHIRRWLIEQGKSFHKKAREFIAKYDRDIAGPKKGKGTTKEAGAKVVLQAFSWSSPLRSIKK